MATLKGIKHNRGVTSGDALDSEGISNAEHSITYLVQTVAGDGRADVLGVCPPLGAPYQFEGETDGLSIARRRRATERIEATSSRRGLWEVVVDYSSQFSLDDDDDLPPEDRTPEWKWTSETRQIRVDVARAKTFLDNSNNLVTENDKPIINAANDPLLGVTMPVAVPVLTISRYQTEFDPDTILDYVNHVNSAEFYGAGAGIALMAGITDRPVKIEGRALRFVEYVVKFMILDPVKLGPTGDEVVQGWSAILLEQGPNYISDAGVKTAALDGAGNRTWVNIDPEDGGLADDLNPAGARYVRWEYLPEADFTQLNLGPF